MPDPTIPGRRSAKTPHPVIPGNSSMGPAAMSMPQPTVGGGSSGIEPGISMPQPSVPTAEPPAYIPGNSSMTAGAPMPQPTISRNAASLSNPSGVPGSGFPQPRSGSSASQRANKRTSFGSAGSSGGASNLGLDMLQFESNGRDRDRALSIIPEDAGSIYGHSPSRANTPGPAASSAFDMNAPPPSWLTNPPVDYSREPVPRTSSAMGHNGFSAHPHTTQSYLSPNGAGPGLRRTESNASSYHITIEPPVSSPQSSFICTEVLTFLRR